MRGAAALLLAGCAPVAWEPGAQPAVMSWLIVHVDPLARRGEGSCASPALTGCGLPWADSQARRTDNLLWLADRWLETGRSLDLELGPEMSLAWAEDPGLVESLAADMAEEGGLDAADAATAVRAQSALAREALTALLDAGQTRLGAHVHAVLPDGDGRFGNARAEAPADDPGPCGAWEGAPLYEADGALVEAVVRFGAEGASALASQLGAPLGQFTGHLPRTLAGKALALSDPDALDGEAQGALPSSWAPVGLGDAYAECLTQAVDHPPFEAWRSDELRALGAGEGALVTPAARVIGSMAPHLDAPSDGSLDAAARRVVQLLLNWRYAAITGEDPRPWVHAFHVHLFELEPGSPDPSRAEARSQQTAEGNAFRGDLEGMAALLDGLAARGEWRGARASDGAVLRWALPEQVDPTGSRFSYARPGEPPPEGLDPALLPYLPLVSERLANSHLACVGEADGVGLYGFQRCAAGWAWGGARPGYACADGQAPAWVYALVPASPTCLSAPGGLALAAPLDGAELDAPPWCGDGIAVPYQGLLVEPAAGPWWSEACGAWGAAL